MAGAALNAGVSPVEIKEIVRQAVADVGTGRALDFLHITNDVLTAGGAELPLAAQSTTTPRTRFDRGRAVQSEFIGADRVERLDATAPPAQTHIQRLLSANCFGDHYTRTGLDIHPRTAHPRDARRARRL